MATPLRIPEAAANPQRVQPESASSAYTSPLVAPMKTYRPKTAGCDRASVTSPRLNAHLSLSLPRASAVRPAEAASWKRELLIFVLQPFHSGVLALTEKPGCVAQVGVTWGPATRAPPVGAI